MTRLWLFSATWFAAVAGAASAAELQSVDRTIAREPAYRCEQQLYGLLVFGPQTTTRVWLVRDGDTLYVDYNGNGDLTEPGEAVHSDSDSFQLGEIREAEGRTVHPSASVTIYPDRRLRMVVNLADGCRQTIGYGSTAYDQPHLARSAGEAPIMHFNGPMTFARFGPVSLLPRKVEGQSYRYTWLRLFVGSPGVGSGTFTSYNCRALRCESGYRKIAAEVVFPNRDPRAEPLKLRQYLEVRG